MAFPHQSQDAQVHSCAETALWSQFRYLSQRYRHYSELYPHDIALLNTDFTMGRTIPSGGLTLRQVASIMRQFGLDAKMYLPDDLPHGNPDSSDSWAASHYENGQDRLLRLLQIYIDSGMPPILGLPRHAVVALGLEYGEAPQGHRRRGGAVPVSDCVTAFFVNDDNFAPYRILRGAERFAEIDALAVPLPSKVFLAAEEAERIATDMLNQIGKPALLGKRWQEPLIARVVCTSSKNYKQYRQRHRDAASDRLLFQPLPHFIWLMELYPLELWPERRAIVEVALDATAGPYDADAYLWIRYPEVMFFNWPRLYGEGLPERVKLDADATGELIGFAGNLQVLSAQGRVAPSRR